MNAKLMEEITHSTLKGEIPFAAAVGKLIAEGVESYHVDFIRNETTYYMPNGENHVVPLSLPHRLPADQFNQEGIQTAIKESQKGELKFADFIPRALLAGVPCYTVYIAGKKVIYFGRYGDLHIELFPQAK